MEPRAEWLLEDARRHDRDRAVAAMLCPESRRAAVLAVVAFNTEIARVRERVGEPTLGHLRLRWWAEALERAGAAEDAEAAPLLRALAELRAWPEIRPCLAALAEARARDIDEPPFADAAAAEDYVAAVTVPLVDALALALGRPKWVGDPAVAAAARAHGLVGLLRATAGRLRRGNNPWAADLADVDARVALGRAVAARARADRRGGGGEAAARGVSAAGARRAGAAASCASAAQRVRDPGSAPRPAEPGDARLRVRRVARPFVMAAGNGMAFHPLWQCRFQAVGRFDVRP